MEIVGIIGPSNSCKTYFMVQKCKNFENKDCYDLNKLFLNKKLLNSNLSTDKFPYVKHDDQNKELLEFLKHCDPSRLACLWKLCGFSLDVELIKDNLSNNNIRYNIYYNDNNCCIKIYEQNGSNTPKYEHYVNKLPSCSQEIICLIGIMIKIVNMLKYGSFYDFEIYLDEIGENFDIKLSKGFFKILEFFIPQNFTKKIIIYFTTHSNQFITNYIEFCRQKLQKCENVDMKAYQIIKFGYEDQKNIIDGIFKFDETFKRRIYVMENLCVGGEHKNILLDLPETSYFQRTFNCKKILLVEGLADQQLYNAILYEAKCSEFEVIRLNGTDSIFYTENNYFEEDPKKYEKKGLDDLKGWNNRSIFMEYLYILFDKKDVYFVLDGDVLNPSGREGRNKIILQNLSKYWYGSDQNNISAENFKETNIRFLTADKFNNLEEFFKFLGFDDYNKYIANKNIKNFQILNKIVEKIFEIYENKGTDFAKWDKIKNCFDFILCE